MLMGQMSWAVPLPKRGARPIGGMGESTTANYRTMFSMGYTNHREPPRNNRDLRNINGLAETTANHRTVVEPFMSPAR